MKLKKICKFFVLATCVFATCVSSAFCADFADPVKQQKWNDVEALINRMSDNRGMPIDEKIKKTVVILNVLGFKTNSSCIGHEINNSCPFLRFEAVSDAESRVTPVQKTYEKERKKLQKKYPKKDIFNMGRKSKKLLEANERLRETFSQIGIDSKKALLPLHQLLAKFYESHATMNDRRLFIHFIGGYQLNTLQCTGSEWQECYTQEERNQRLKEFQQEMDQFTEFLIKHYEELPNS